MTGTRSNGCSKRYPPGVVRNWRSTVGSPQPLSRVAEQWGVRADVRAPWWKVKRRPPIQLEIAGVVATIARWGGPRKGAGRKPKREGGRPNVPHRTRPAHKSRYPVHVTMRAARGMPSFRSQLISRILKKALWRQSRRPYAAHFRVVHFSIQKDHLHLIVEAIVEGTGPRADAAARDMLRRGVSGLAISFARRLNFALNRRGKVWGDRHHRRDLASPTDVRNTILYVLENYLRHGEIGLGGGVVDFYSSASRFDGWAEPHAMILDTEPWPAPNPRTWLLSSGWMRAGGKIRMWELPAGAIRRSYRDA